MSTQARIHPSAIAQYQTCPTKWYRRYVMDQRVPQTDRQRVGTEFHKQLEDLLTQGKMVRRPSDEVREMLLAHVGNMPVKVEGMLCEAPLMFPSPWNPEQILYVGTCDLVHVQGQKAWITDFKTLRNFGSRDHKISYVKSGTDLQSDPQAVIYSAAVFISNPAVQTVLLQWQYFQTQVPFDSTTSSVEITRQDCMDRLQHLESRYVLDMIRLSDLPHTGVVGSPSEVPKDVTGCQMFGGCPYGDTCVRDLVAVGKLIFKGQKVQLRVIQGGKQDGT